MTGSPQLVSSSTECYSVVSVCIYCGSTIGLEDEHIVPFGLGGTAILPAASCRACATVTSRFELTVLRGPMRPIRVALGIRSRRKHRGAPTLLPLRVRRGDQWETCALPYDEYPLVLEFFVLGIPGCADDSYTSGVRVRGYQRFSFGPRPEVVQDRLGVDQISAPRRYVPTDFAKMTAKIGYAMAVAVGAIDPACGRPDVVRSILGDVDEIGRWVGTLAEPRALRPDVLHDASVHSDSKSGVLFARVQNLAIVGSPVYGVVLGRLDEPFIRSRTFQNSHQPSRECNWATHAAPFGLDTRVG
jgi:hypothetical protein